MRIGLNQLLRKYALFERTCQKIDIAERNPPLQAKLSCTSTRCALLQRADRHLAVCPTNKPRKKGLRLVRVEG